MKKILSVLALMLAVSCSIPDRPVKIPKGLDGIEVVNPQDGMQYRLQYIKGRGYYPVAADTVYITDSTFYFKYSTIK